MKERDERDILEEQLGAMGGNPVDENPEVPSSQDAGQDAGNHGLGHAKYFGSRASHDDGGVDVRKDTRLLNTGWIEVDREEFEGRAQFYPSDYRFYVKPVTVADIKNWSSIDETRPDQVYETLDEIMKSNIKITSSTGNIPCGKLNSWDRFFMLLKLREYSVDKGIDMQEITYDEVCEECNNPVKFKLTSSALCFDLPDQDIIDRYWNAESRVWIINPAEYDVKGPIIKLYPPTIEKERAVLKWGIERRRNDKKYSDTFVNYLPWMLAKVSRDDSVNEKLISEAEGQFNMWGLDMWSLVDDIIRNIAVSPEERLRAICPHCGEEVVSDVRFPDGIRSIFSVQGGHKKFGKK